MGQRQRHARSAFSSASTGRLLDTTITSAAAACRFPLSPEKTLPTQHVPTSARRRERRKMNKNGDFVE